MQKFPAISQKISIICNNLLLINHHQMNLLKNPPKVHSIQELTCVRSTFPNRPLLQCQMHSFALTLSDFPHLDSLKSDAKFQSKKLQQFPQIFFRFFSPHSIVNANTNNPLSQFIVNISRADKNFNLYYCPFSYCAIFFCSYIIND